MCLRSVVSSYTVSASFTALLCSFLGAQSVATPSVSPLPSATTASPSTPLGSGDFKAIMISEPTLVTHTVYRPADLSANGLGKLPSYFGRMAPAATRETHSARS